MLASLMKDERIRSLLQNAEQKLRVSCAKGLAVSLIATLVTGYMVLSSRSSPALRPLDLLFFCSVASLLMFIVGLLVRVARTSLSGDGSEGGGATIHAQARDRAGHDESRFTSR